MREHELNFGSRIYFVKSGVCTIQRFILCVVLVVFPTTLAFSSSVDELEAVVNSASGTYLAARFADNSHDISTSALYYSKVLRSDPENLELLRKSFIQTLANGEISHAIKLANQLINYDNNHAIARATLGANAIKDQQYYKSTDFLDIPNAVGFNKITNAILTAWALHGLGHTETAINSISQLEGQPWFPFFTEYHIGLILEHAGRTNEAGSHFTIAYDIDRSKLRVVLAHVRSLIRSGNTQQALNVINNYDASYPGNPKIALFRDKIQNQQGIQSDIHTIQDGVAELFYGLGAAFERGGAEDHVAIYMHLALFLNPELDEAYDKLGDLFSSLNQHEIAIRYFESIEHNSLLYRTAQRKIGISYHSLDELEKTRQILSDLIESDPKDTESAKTLGNVYRANKLFAEAIEAYSLAVNNLVNIAKHHWDLFYYRGIAHERNKNWDEAEEDFKTALSLNPDQPLVLNYLGYTWVDRGENLEPALKMLNRAVELRPNAGFIVDSLGWGYFKLGQYENAVKHLERAVEIQPEDPTLNDHLGDAYWHVGRKLEAKFQWSHAKELNPEPNDLEKILQKLEHGYISDEQSSILVNTN